MRPPSAMTLAEHFEAGTVRKVRREVEGHGNGARELPLGLVPDEQVERDRVRSQREIGDLPFPHDVAPVVEVRRGGDVLVGVGIPEGREVRRPQEALQREGPILHRGRRIRKQDPVDLEAGGIVPVVEQEVLGTREGSLDVALAEGVDRGCVRIDAQSTARRQEDARHPGPRLCRRSQVPPGERSGEDERSASQGDRQQDRPQRPAGQARVELLKLSGIDERLDLVPGYAAAEEVHAPERHGVAGVLVEHLEPELQRLIGLRALEVDSREAQQGGDRPRLQLPRPPEVRGRAAEVAAAEARGTQHEEVIGTLAEAEHLGLEQPDDIGEPARPEEPPGVVEVPGRHAAAPLTRGPCHRALHAPSRPRSLFRGRRAPRR